MAEARQGCGRVEIQGQAHQDRGLAAPRREAEAGPPGDGASRHGRTHVEAAAGADGDGCAVPGRAVRRQLQADPRHGRRAAADHHGHGRRAVLR
eukprot:10513797-Alexandrium_andersonii.AAC.1